MTKTLDDTTKASYPGQVRLSPAKLRRLQPELYERLSWVGWDWEFGRPWTRRSLWLTRIAEHLLFGDSRAAVVISTSPLLIAAYTDEIDCIALLRFDDSFVSEYGLEPGSRLVTVNIYEYMDGSYETDLIPGPGARGFYRNFIPFIADFLTDDIQRLNERKAEIGEHEWRRTEELAHAYLNESNNRPRDGRPFWCSVPADRADLSGRSRYVDSASHAVVTLLEIPKRLLTTIGLAFFTLWAIREIRVSPRLGWFGFVVLGTLTMLSVRDIFRLPRDLKRRVSVREAWTVHTTIVWIVTGLISLVLSLVGELIFTSLDRFWPNFAIWLSTFVTTVALYPIAPDVKKDYPTLTPWVMFAGIWGVVTVALAHFLDWLEKS